MYPKYILFLATLLLFSQHCISSSIPCKPGGYCVANREDNPHCECSVVGLVQGTIPRCGTLIPVSGTWQDCNDVSENRCAVTSNDAAANLIWLGGDSMGKCDHVSCGWTTFSFAAQIQFPSTAPIGEFHAAGILFRAKRVFKATNGPQGSFDRLGYHGYMLTLSPVTGVAELFHFRRDGTVTSIPSDNPVVGTMNPALSRVGRSILVQFIVIGTSFEVKIDGLGSQKFNGVLLDPELQSGSVGLFSTRQSVTFGQVVLGSTEPCFVPCPTGTFQTNWNQTTADACIACDGPDGPVANPGERVVCDKPGVATGVEECEKGTYCTGGTIEEEPKLCPYGTKGVARGASTMEEACRQCLPGETGCMSPGISEDRVFPTFSGFFSEGKYDPYNTCYCYPANPNGCGAPLTAIPKSRSAWDQQFVPGNVFADSNGIRPLILAQFSSEPITQRLWFGTTNSQASPVCDSPTCTWNDIQIDTVLVLLTDAQNSARRTFEFFFRLQRSPDIPAGYGLRINPVLKTMDVFLYPWDGPAETLASVQGYDWPLGKRVRIRITVVRKQITVRVFRPDDEGNIPAVIDIADDAETFPEGTIGFATTAGLRAEMYPLRVELGFRNSFRLCATLHNSEQQCPPGTTQTERGQSSCVACPPGFYNCHSYGSGYRRKATVCEPGYSCAGGANERLECPVGTFSKSRAAECTPCPTGSFANQTITPDQCEPCPPQFVNINNSTECKACPAEMFSYSQVSNCQGLDGVSRFQFSSIDEDCQRMIEFNSREGNTSTLLEVECFTLTAASDAGQLLLGIVLLSLLVNIAILAAWIYFWKNPIVRASQRGLSVAIIVGAIATNLSLMPELAPKSTAVCSLATFLPLLAVTFTLGCLFSKIRRAHNIFNVESKKLQLQRSKVLPIVVPVISIMAVQILIIGFWVLVDPPIVNTGEVANLEAHQKFCNDPSCTPSIDLQYCSRNQDAALNMAFIGYGFVALILVSCCQLAWQARNLTSMFAEAKLVAFTVYSITLVAVFVLIGSSVMEDDQGTAQTLLLAVGLSLISTIMLLGLFGPKIYAMFRYNSESLASLVRKVVNEISNPTTHPRMVSATGSSWKSNLEQYALGTPRNVTQDMLTFGESSSFASTGSPNSSATMTGDSSPPPPQSTIKKKSSKHSQHSQHQRPRKQHQGSSSNGHKPHHKRVRKPRPGSPKAQGALSKPSSFASGTPKAHTLSKANSYTPGSPKAQGALSKPSSFASGTPKAHTLSKASSYAPGTPKTHTLSKASSYTPGTPKAGTLTSEDHRNRIDEVI